MHSARNDQTDAALAPRLWRICGGLLLVLVLVGLVLRVTAGSGNGNAPGQTVAVSSHPGGGQERLAAWVAVCGSRWESSSRRVAGR